MEDTGPGPRFAAAMLPIRRVLLFGFMIVRLYCEDASRTGKERKTFRIDNRFRETTSTKIVHFFHDDSPDRRTTSTRFFEKRKRTNSEFKIQNKNF